MSGERTPERLEAGLRRAADLQPDAPLPESDPRLVRRIGEEIRARGPITFARFMELALYDAEAGYYTTAVAGPGRHGDFLTAPEGHPIFGWTVARHLEAVWDRLARPDRFVLREHGAGRGGLAAGLLDGLRRSGSPLLKVLRYQAIDVAPAWLGVLRERLEGLGVAQVLEPPDAYPEVGAVVANELLDALPVHLVEGGPGGEIRERYVTVSAVADAARPFSSGLGPPSTPAIEVRLAEEGVTLAPGQRAEVCIEVDRWVTHAAATIERGELLLIDYGKPAAELYDPRRGSTLRAYHRHRVHGDPFVAIGRQDLTAHVDVTAVERAAAAAGLDRLGRTTQAAFLADLGLGQLLVAMQSGPEANLERYLNARSAVVRMLDPKATGGFSVMAFGRGIDASPPLPGLRGGAG